MKRLFSALMLLIVCTVSAQHPGAPPSIEEKLKRAKEMLGKELKLNTSQINVTTEAFTKFFKQADNIFKGNPPSSPAQMKQIEALEKERDQKIISILNEQQIKGYKEIVLKMRPPKPGQGKQQGPPPQKQ